jgi:hypothetical protein
VLLRRLHALVPSIRAEFDQELRALPEGWSYLHVTYEHPHVRRLWKQYGSERVFLHCFEPIPAGEAGLLHHHPWPAASLIVEGGYGMDLELDGVLVATTWQCAGSAYELSDPRVRHVVRPDPGDAGSVWSIMITGAPFEAPIGLLKPANPGERLEPTDARAIAYALEWSARLRSGLPVAARE